MSYIVSKSDVLYQSVTAKNDNQRFIKRFVLTSLSHYCTSNRRNVPNSLPRTKYRYSPPVTIHRSPVTHHLILSFIYVTNLRVS